jgi:hypothetical protein
LAASAYAPGLVELPSAIIAGVGSVDEESDFPGPSGILDAVRAIDEVSCARFHANAVERRLPKRRLGALAEIGGNTDVIGLEGALERRLQLALGVSSVELGAADADPRSTARSPGPNIWRNNPVRTESEPDQLLPGALAAGENARPFGDVLLTLL